MPDHNPYHPPDAPLAPHAATPKPYHAQYDGLGGWLVLVGIGVVITPIQMVRHFISTYKMIFIEGSWEAATTPGADGYHALWAPFLLTETAFAALSVLVTCYMVHLFFGKKKAFPKWFIWGHTVNLVFLIADVSMLQVVRPDLPFLDPESSKEIGRSMISFFIWVPYMWLSKRVHSTFTR